MDRREALTVSLAALGAALVADAAPAQSVPPAGSMSKATAFAFSFPALSGTPIRLADHAGKPILIVNTASLCGYTPQYTGLQELWSRYGERGLLVLGVPSNDFGGQEPGGASDIIATVHDHRVTFPIAEKVSVRGEHAHPFYKWAASERPLEVPRWNFHKYLVGRDGHIAGSFASEVTPDDRRLTAAIERQLISV